MYTRENRNLKAFKELALAYERQGNGLHPMLAKVLTPFRRVDCLPHKPSCKHYSRGKCKITDKYARNKLCPYNSSITPRFEQTDKVEGLPPKASQQSATSARRILEDGVFRYTSGRGYYYTSCKVWIKYAAELIRHSQSKRHKMRMALR